MKIAVIVTDATGAIHAGLDVTRTVRMFDLPAEIGDYIAGNVREYITCTFALMDEQGEGK